MPATINGSPTHVLIVHAVVVLLPLAIIASLTLIVVPRIRRAFGLLTVGVAFVGCIAVPAAFLSGGKLRRRLPPSPLISRHVAMAHQLLPAAAAFGVSLAVFVAVDIRRRAPLDQLNIAEAYLVARFVRGWNQSRRTYRGATRVSAGLLAVLAVLAAVTVVRAGDSGAKAAWSHRIASSTSSPPTSTPPHR